MPYHRKRHKRRRMRLNTRGVIAVTSVLVLLIVLVAVLIFLLGKNKDKDTNHDERTLEPVTTEVGETIVDESTVEETEAPLQSDVQNVLDEAEIMAEMYDYDKAVEYVKTNIPNYESYPQLTGFISEAEAKKSLLVKWPDNTKITHVFFHTLMWEPEISFKSDGGVAYNQVMTTISEFNIMIEEMYNRGYVMVRLSDIASIDETSGEMKYNPIYLPEGKIPFVLSEDDVSYYEYMCEDGGYPNRLIVTEDGKIMNEADNADGTKTVGAFDVVPLIDEFVEKHPDFSYHGAKGIVALTGYNGILGYKTSYLAYGTPDVIQAHYQDLFCGGNYDEQHAYDLAIGVHEYDVADIEAEREKAKLVAQAMKDEGWEFASHTWGHMPMDQVVDKPTGTVTSERFFRDTKWWDTEVRPLLPEVDTIIFAKGADIGSWRGYSDENQAYMYLKADGFDYYCNVDSAQYYVQLSGNAGGSGYLRQGRRNLDGMMLFKACMYPEKMLVDDLFDALTTWDNVRPQPVEGVTLPDWYDGSTLEKPQWAIDRDKAESEANETATEAPATEAPAPEPQPEPQPEEAPAP